MSSRLHRHPSRFWHFSAPCTSIVIPGCVTLSPRRPRDGCAASLWAWRRSELPGLSGSLSTLFRLRLTFSPPTYQQYPPICHLSHTRGLASLSLSFFFFFVEYVGLWLRARQSRRTFVCQQPVTAREAILERASNKPQTKRKNWEAGRIRRLCSFITFSHISSDLPHLLGRALLYGRSCGPVVSLLPSSATRRTKHQQQHSTITSPQRSQRLSIRAGLATASFFPPSTHILRS